MCIRDSLLAKRQYLATTGRVRGADDVIAYHVRQSFRPGEIDVYKRQTPCSVIFNMNACKN